MPGLRETLEAAGIKVVRGWDGLPRIGDKRGPLLLARLDQLGKEQT